MIDPSKLLTSKQGACIGVTLGLTKACVMTPLYINQIRLQNGYPITFDLRILYLEFYSILTNTIAIGLVQITFSAIFNQILSSGLVGTKDEIKRNIINRFASTFLGGAVSAIVSTPIDVMMALKQEDEHRGKSTTSLLIEFLKKNNLKKLFTGLPCDILVDAICLCSFFALYPLLHLGLKNVGLQDPFAAFFSIALSTLVSTLLCHPVDLIKTNQQKFSMTRVPSVIETFRTIWQKSNKKDTFLKKLLVFYAGFTSRLVLAATSYSISGPLAERMEHMYILRGGSTKPDGKSVVLKQNFQNIKRHIFFKPSPTVPPLRALLPSSNLEESQIRNYGYKINTLS